MKYNFLRDVILLIAGLSGILHETVIENSERPTLLMLFAAMIGLPAFLRKDAKDDR
jgi:hypothetical protein